MSLPNPTQIVFAFAACLAPMAALSQTVSLTYAGTAALVMLAPQTASFDCAFDDFPAEVVITEDALAQATASFPFGLPHPKARQRVLVRRGVDLSAVPVADTSIGFQSAFLDETTPEPTISPDDWTLSLTGKVQLCAGLATLEVVQEEFTVSARFGEHETRFRTDKYGALVRLLRDYQAETSILNRPYQLEAGAKVQSIGSAPRPEGRPLGLLSFRSFILPVTLKTNGDSPDFDIRAHLTIELILVDPLQN